VERKGRERRGYRGRKEGGNERRGRKKADRVRQREWGEGRGRKEGRRERSDLICQL